MKYAEENLKKAEKAGVFDSSVDPKILSLDDEEKQRLSQDFSKMQNEMTPTRKDPETTLPKASKIKAPLNVPLSFFEKIIAFLLQAFGIKTLEEFKINKLLKGVEKELSYIKPPIFISSNKRITRIFAYKIHDLFLKLLWIKKVFSLTIDNPKQWNNINLPKTVVEIFFEKINDISSDEIDSYFSEEGLTRIIKQFGNPKLAMEAIEKNLQNYLSSMDVELIRRSNQFYTNLMYFKALSEYDFLSLFRRFDPSFEVGKAPNFNDIPGDALLSYLLRLEELLFHIDLSSNHSSLFIVLNKIASQVQEEEEENFYETPEITDPSPVIDGLQEDKILQELGALTQLLKELTYKKYLTLIIRMLKRNPTYQPSFIHNSFDLFRIYSETLEKRVKSTAKKIIKSHKQKDIEANIHKLFSKLHWVGIYTPSVSADLEKHQYPSFQYTYFLAVIYSFLALHYKEIMKNSINILLLNGVFSEKNFHKQLADTFYSMDKYIVNFEEFLKEIQADGSTGKKLLSFLNKKISYHAENRKIIEKIIVNINGRAKDLCDQFSRLFFSFAQLIDKIYIDIDAKPPKYVKNIRSIGGFKNAKFLQTIEKSQYILKSLKNTIHLLQD